jgi:hypothetical protein
MIDFDSWFENIVSTANLIASPHALNQVWIQGDKNVTSAYDFNELLEQLLGDLHLQEETHRFHHQLRQIDAFEPITEFAQQLLGLERLVSNDLRLQDPQNLLTSPGWVQLKNLAQNITQLPAAKVYTKERT